MSAASAQPVLSLAMIVRDSADVLSACLTSIRPWVDDLVVVDTGSRDNTREIAAAFGARLFEFPWCDDFSAARNESLRHALGQWVFWMDADDTIDAENGKRLRELAYGNHDPQCLGYVIRVLCPGRGECGLDEATAVDHVKLFRNHSGLSFKYRIHEQLLESIRDAGGMVAWTDLFVVHSGADTSPAGRAKKHERDLRILALELQDRPDHPFTLFNHGMTHSDKGDHRQAVDYLERSLAISSPRESHVRKVYALLVHSFDQLGSGAKAQEICKQGLALYPDDPELLFRFAKLAHEAGHLEEARDALVRVLAHQCERHFTSVDRSLMGYKARHNLALVYQDLRRFDLAELEWRLVIQSQPKFTLAWRQLGQLLVKDHKLAAADVLLSQMRDQGTLDAAEMTEVDIALALHEHDRARSLLLAAMQRYPQNMEALESLCQLEFEHGRAEDAVTCLTRLVEQRPQDAAAHHNLGAMHLRIGDVSEAQQALERSLELRPDSRVTRELLEVVLRMHGHASPTHRSRCAPTPLVAAPAAPAPSIRRETLDVAIVTVGYNLPGATRQLVESALLDCRHRLTFFLASHSAHPEKVREFETLAARADVVLRDYRTNRGLARSWNEGVLWAYEKRHDVVLVVNEDIVFEAGDVARLASAAWEQRDRFVVMGRCLDESVGTWTSSSYGCFAINPPALEVLGCFDENFFPVYCEDSDYRRRATLTGLEPGYCESVAIRHGGSSSLKQPEVASQNLITYAANVAYYARKWGGPASVEAFERPFNDQRFGNFIDPRVRHAPYPGFDRADHHIVVI